jgi:hypothetical protein
MILLSNIRVLLAVFAIVFSVSGCTYSINMVHTAGQASDVIDEVQSNEPDVSPTIAIPVQPI